MKILDFLWKYVYYVPIIFLIVAYLLSPTDQENCLDYNKHMREKEYSGKVLSKYIDTKNHNSETIELKMYTDTILVALTLDKSGLYDFVNKGDSIVKIKGEGVVKVFRAMTKVETFMIERNCKD